MCMSMAIAHFAVGISIGALVIMLAELEDTWYQSLIPYVFGLWAMIPDTHHIIPITAISEFVHQIHGSPVANVFMFHRTIDLYDTGDTKIFAGACLMVMLVCLCAMWFRLYTER